MKEEFSHEDIQKKFNAVNKLLSKEGDNMPKETKAYLEEVSTILAASLMNHWLPRDLGRKLIMLIILIIGISKAVAENPLWLLILLILPLFSPKIILRISIIIGYLKGNHKK